MPRKPKPEKGLVVHKRAYHQKDCDSTVCGGTFRCSVCRYTYGWCCGHAGSKETCGTERAECPKCDRCCVSDAAVRAIRTISRRES